MPSKIGYVIDGHHNDSYMLLDVANLSRCPQCGELLDRVCSLGHFTLSKRRDVSATYDGYTIVSQRFVDAWKHLNATGLRFTPLPLETGFFLLDADDILEFDSERRQTRFVDYRPCCGRYHSVAGATPAYLKHPEQLRGRHAFRTDVMFGSGDAKNPMILVSKDIGAALKAAKLSGLDMSEVMD